MEVPDDLRYSKEHEWARVDGDSAEVGITDYAQSELGDIVYVELPQIGQELKKGEAFGTIEAVKAVSELFCPVSGEVAAINDKLEGDPALVNQSPYADGWMIKVTLTNPDEVTEMMDAAAYKEMTGA
jgi:glycine cleavage system H protein